MKRILILFAVIAFTGMASGQVTVDSNVTFKMEDTKTTIEVASNSSFQTENLTIYNDTMEMGGKNFSFTQYENGSYESVDVTILEYNFSIEDYPHTLMKIQLNSDTEEEETAKVLIDNLPNLKKTETGEEPIYRLTRTDGNSAETGDQRENISLETTLSGSSAIMYLRTGVVGSDGTLTDGSTSDSTDDGSTSDDGGGSTGGGGGGGGAAGGFTDEEAENITNTIEELREELGDPSEYIDFSSSSIDAELKPGETRTVSVSMLNNLNRSQNFTASATSNVNSYLDYEEELTVSEGESRDIQVEINVPEGERAQSTSGSLDFSSELVEETSIPVNLEILPPDSSSLNLELEPLFDSVEPGKTARVEASLAKDGHSQVVNVTTDVSIRDPETDQIIASKTTTVRVGNSKKDIVELEIPENTTYSSYELRGNSSYSSFNESGSATDVETISVQKDFLEREIAGVKYKDMGIAGLLLLGLSAIGYAGYSYRQAIIAKKRRYDEELDISTIPTEDREDRAYVGQLAERGQDTYVNMNQLTTHALVAGATGSGKTVTGQVMVEEALKEGKNIIVLDPTAQWTGFLRENEDSKMFKHYDEFSISTSDAQAFNGNIRAVEPGESIDITPYLNPDSEVDGQIIVFSLHKLDSKNIDKFVNETIQQIFDANLPEQNQLETLVVYDEVHRLLEEFGGGGEGLKQLERGAREFRKWGVGMLLLSQVISDFPGEVRANIGTTIQMRTQYEDDLERMKDKFGADTVKSIAKAEIGSGMIQNSDYNHGRPYFVDFRPLLHSPHRLSDEELEKYEKYNKMIDKMEEKVNRMEESGNDVYELESEIKLAKKNLKKGSFNLVETYVEELKEKIQQ